MARKELAVIFVLLALIQIAEPQCNVDADDRVECGFGGVSQQQCEDRGCCFDNSIRGTFWCFEEEIVPPNELPGTCSIGQIIREDCGFNGISESECEARDCCYSPIISGLPIPFCYRRINFDITITEIEIAGITIRLPDFQGCRLSTLASQGKEVVDSFLEIARSTSFPNAIVNILDNSDIFSIRKYCGMFSLAVDALTGCAAPFLTPFGSVFPNIDTIFFDAMNSLAEVKAPCRVLSGVGLQSSTNLCIPTAAELCPLNTVDVLTAFSSFTTDLDMACNSLETSLRGVSTCIEEAVEGCPTSQKASFDSVINTYKSLADEAAIYCNEGCYDLIEFIADQHPTCSWNIQRLYPDATIENYCEYVHFAVTCGWLLWQGCPILPEEYFQKAMSVVEIAVDLGGCTEVELDGYIRNPAFQITLPPCVQASTNCGKKLAEGVGIEVMGPYGGYTFSNVQTRVNAIGSNLQNGNFKDLCGNPDHLDAGENPIRDCINNLADNCAADPNSQSAVLAGQAAVWYDEACAEGCYELADRIINFRPRCNVDININPSNIPINLILGQVAPIGNQAPECRFIKAYASCIATLISECTFLHNRIQDARRLLLDSVLGTDIDPDVEIYVCGVKLDYPIFIQSGDHAVISVSSAASKRPGVFTVLSVVLSIGTLLYTLISPH